jgi:hypothetical protein
MNFTSYFLNAWWGAILLFCTGLSLLLAYGERPSALFVSFTMIILAVLWLLLWATDVDRNSKASRQGSRSMVGGAADSVGLSMLQSELAARIREAAAFKVELEAKHAEIAALKSGLNRTDDAELNDAIAQIYVGFEFERGRAEGEFAQVLAGLSESVDGLFAAAALVKGAPTPGERFVDQPAGSCKVFKTELTSDVALKGTIKAVRSPWVGFMANGKLKVITASNVSVYA